VSARGEKRRLMMELLLLHEFIGWEKVFWKRLEALLDEISNYRVEVKERLRREWRAAIFRCTQLSEGWPCPSRRMVGQGTNFQRSCPGQVGRIFKVVDGKRYKRDEGDRFTFFVKRGSKLELGSILG
jgi:hypothetical protein